jgi:hypothetical protein
MIEISDDMLCLKRGSLIQVQAWQQTLRAGGMKSRVIGDHRTGGLGTTVPGSVELWIHSADVDAAESAMAEAYGNRRQEPETYPVLMYGRPVSAPKPDRSRAL